MGRQKQINTMAVCGLIIAVTAMTIGFAALSQRLDISGTATVNSAAQSWNINFSKVDTTNGLLGNATWATQPSVTTDTDNNGSNNKITFACTLTAPGDSCALTATVKNSGTTTAKYTGYTITVDGQNVSAGSSLSDGTAISVTEPETWAADTTELAKDGTGDFILKAELPSTVTTLPSSTTAHSITVSINFTQA